MANQEAELRREIESLRRLLNEEIGDTYEKNKVQKARDASSRLDTLICRWLETQAKKGGE